MKEDVYSSSRTMTAVEWLEERYKANGSYLTKSDINSAKEMEREQRIDFARHCLDRAKEMEKKQHNETWDSAHQAGRFEGKGIAEENWQTFETYWEETFKSE